MTELNLNIFNILIISGVVYGLIFSITVLSHRKHLRNNVKYLSFIVLFLSLSNFQYWLLDTNLIELYPILKFIYIPWHWLVLPMFYLYVQKFIGRKPISKKLIIYLIGPFLIIQILHISQVIYKLFVDSDYDLPSHFSRGIFVYIEFFSVIFNVVLMILTFRMIVRHENDTSYDIKWVKSETNWLKKLIYLGILICLFWLIAIVIVVIFNLGKSYVFYPMWIGISILVYWIGYIGLQNSKNLEQRISLRRQRIKVIESRELDFQSELSQLAGLEYSDKNYLTVKNLEKLIYENKLYLNPNLNLELLAEVANLSTSNISKSINKVMGISFKDYINQLRLEDAKKMLKDENFKHYTITAIALESGFNSKSAFYRSFKKVYNSTPSEFREV